MQKDTKSLIWIDLEMTGLCIRKDKIIELALIVTDKNLKILKHGPSIVIKQEKHLMNSMDSWNTVQHKKSGLYQKVLESRTSCEEAEMTALSFLNNMLERNTSPMCGNSVHQDRMFLKKHMPKLESFFYYRNLDVSSIKEVVKYWKPNIYKQFKKNCYHTAMSDVKESIRELEFYKKKLF